jgi:hypothetical protein
MTAAEALAFVQQHGVVLVAARGPVPRLTEAIIDEPIKGSWWAHPKSHHIFAILQAVTDSEVVLVCRLVDGKVTLRSPPPLAGTGQTRGTISARTACQDSPRTYTLRPPCEPRNAISAMGSDGH